MAQVPSSNIVPPKRQSQVEPIEVQRILTPADAVAPPKPSPPTSPTYSAASSSRRSFQSSARASSTAPETASIASSRTNRFSLSFPVQPSTDTSPVRSTIVPTKDGPPVPAETLAAPTGPTEPNFLRAIAAQERKVLELKEELQRAQAELDNLKREWTKHEASKKRNDARRMTRLEPLRTVSPPAETKEDDSDASNAWIQQEIERRKTLLDGSRHSRRVFSGSRHTRALSLLTAASDRMEDASSSSRKRSPARARSNDKAQSRPALTSRASTTPDLTNEVAATADAEIDLSSQTLDRDLIMRTGKKVASDIRDGLWTFWEDLRQATVGDEATQIPRPSQIKGQGSTETIKAAKKQGSRNSMRANSRESAVGKPGGNRQRPSPVQFHSSKQASTLPDLADPDFWTEYGVTPTDAVPAPVKPSPAVRAQTRSSPKPASSQWSEAWEAWEDTPKESPSSGTNSKPKTPPLTASQPDGPQSGAETPQKDPIPWPALSKLGPQTLKRTASHLMQEWERSSTRSPGKEVTAEGDYLQSGTLSVTPGEAGKKTN